jgi:tRNA(fMet)-specific endonuclease VapC
LNAKRYHKKISLAEELDIFLDSPRVAVHAIDVETADFCATILDNLRAAGTPIPTNDIWIAAVSFQNGYC